MSRCLLFVLCAPNAELAVRMANWLSDFTTAEISPSTPEEHRRQLEFEIMVPATGGRTLLLWNQNPRCEQFQAVWRDVVSCRAWQLAVETLLVLTSLVFLVFFVLLVLLLLTSSTKKNLLNVLGWPSKGRAFLSFFNFFSWDQETNCFHCSRYTTPNLFSRLVGLFMFHFVGFLRLDFLGWTLMAPPLPQKLWWLGIPIGSCSKACSSSWKWYAFQMEWKEERTYLSNAACCNVWFKFVTYRFALDSQSETAILWVLGENTCGTSPAFLSLRQASTFSFFSAFASAFHQHASGLA